MFMVVKLEWPKTFFRAGAGGSSRCANGVFLLPSETRGVSKCFLKFQKRRRYQSSVVMQKCCKVVEQMLVLSGERAPKAKSRVCSTGITVCLCFAMPSVSQDLFLNEVGFA